MNDNWAQTIEKIYLAISRIFDGFLNFIKNIMPEEL